MVRKHASSTELVLQWSWLYKGPPQEGSRLVGGWVRWGMGLPEGSWQYGLQVAARSGGDGAAVYQAPKKTNSYQAKEFPTFHFASAFFYGLSCVLRKTFT